ncbi:MAG: SirB2 family protein [Gammaproteobacteria bacterium]|nr:SirB2 family protein [Gammaproteobacteria bacterium]
MPDHLLLKLLHQTTAVLSISGFMLRGGLMLADSTLLRRRWMRTWPHFIDTLLLASGIWMAINLQLNPLQHPWLMAKLVALLAYIALGFIALRLGRTKSQRTLALVGALACFAYIGLVALTKSVIPF